MRLVFMGTPAVAVPALERLVAAGHDVAAVFSQPDRPSGRKHVVVASAVKVAAERLGIPVHQPDKIRTDETRQLFASFAPDVAVVFAYGRILPPGLLEVPAHGCINIHASLLPKYRGAAPIQWAIARGETVTGVTTMQMEEGLDTGDILMQRSISIAEGETAIELSERLGVLGAQLIVETLDSLATITPTPQDDAAASLAPILKREDGLIDWRLPARSIYNHCRGLQPWPGAWTELNGARLHIWRCEPCEGDEDDDEGIITEASGDRLVVACGQHSLRILELQLEGKKRLGVKEFLNGHRLTPGEVLGA